MSFINISKLAPVKTRGTNETEQQMVIRMIKGDFEKFTGIPFDRFCQIYKKTLQDEPEKLI